MKNRSIKFSKKSIPNHWYLVVIAAIFAVINSSSQINRALAQDQDQTQDQIQESQQPVIQQSQESLTEEQLLFYLSNEKVVVPGVGFVNGQIGDSMGAILEAWGEPLAQRKTGLMGSIEYLYRPDPNTLIVFTGKRRLRTISIKGNAASLLRTKRGARFGLSSLNIVRLYSQNTNVVRNNRIEYPGLGISFYVTTDSRVNKIVVYTPGS